MRIYGVEGKSHRTLVGEIRSNGVSVTGVLEKLETEDTVKARSKELFSGETVALVGGVRSFEEAAKRLLLIEKFTVESTRTNGEARRVADGCVVRAFWLRVSGNRCQ